VLLDSLGDYESMPDWAEVADVLFGNGLTLNPSELHGAVAGLLAASVGAPLGSTDSLVAQLEKALAIDLQGEATDISQRIILATISAARDADFAFLPMLPDDDDSFEHRLISVGRWAAGFLTGFTQAVAARQGQADPVAPDTAEVIKDFAAIAQLDVDEPESDDADRELEELIEYLRIAALNVLQDALSQED